MSTDRSVIHEKIAEITELININNNRLFLHDDKIAQIEIDLLRKNAIELYEQINLLHITNLKSKSTVVLTDAHHDAIALKEDAAAVNADPVSTSTPEIELIIETPQIEPVITQKEEPEMIEWVEETPVEPEPEAIIETPAEIIPEPIPEEPVTPTQVPEAVNETKKNEENTLKEKPTSLPSDMQPELFEIKTVFDNPSKNKSGGTPDIKNIFEKYRTSKIDSIKKAISILKKYEFQNQLFGNDPKVYNQSIEMLDQAASAEVAISLLENSWPEQYKWTDKEEKLIEELKELVYRRFS